MQLQQYRHILTLLHIQKLICMRQRTGKKGKEGILAQGELKPRPDSCISATYVRQIQAEFDPEM